MPGETNERRVPRVVQRKLLIVSSTEKGRETLTGLLAGSVYWAEGAAANGGEARRLLTAQGFDAVLINTPLPDEFGVELARFAAEQGIPTLLAVTNQHVEEVTARVAADGVLTIGKPLSPLVFHQALSLLDAGTRRVEKLTAENNKLRAKLEEVRLIGRAKCFLVQYRGLTEPEAHRLIEKEAMDRRISRKAVAGEVIQMYEE